MHVYVCMYIYACEAYMILRRRAERAATDAGGLVAAGKFTRVVVGIEDFMSKCCSASS